MKLLLDTHVFLWLLTAPDRLGEHVHLVEDSNNDLLVSAASSWEIAIKYQMGKLPLPEVPARYIPWALRQIGAEAVAVDHSHALAVATLPPLHRDPFDRLLVAQSTLLDLTLMTADQVLVDYPISTILV